MSIDRAKELLILTGWECGGCLCKGSVKPNVSPMTDEERNWLWTHTKYNLYSTLCEVANGRAVEVFGGAA